MRHRTTYRYGAPVERCRNEVHLRPRDTPNQVCLEHEFRSDPLPVSWSERLDHFGNTVTGFAVDGPFDILEVIATSVVETSAPPAPDPLGPSWTEVRDLLATDLNPEVIEAREFCFSSPLVPETPAAFGWATSSFPAGRPLVEAVTDLNMRIHSEFDYVPGTTSVSTPSADVLEHRSGVCQDFAHLAIAALRSLGLAARYVSGYLETNPPPGAPRLVGADASHAWFSVFVPGHGWFDLDPTNNVPTGEHHVTTAWGRDYGDVPPVKGIVFGGGSQPELAVAVDVEPIRT